MDTIKSAASHPAQPPPASEANPIECPRCVERLRAEACIAVDRPETDARTQQSLTSRVGQAIRDSIRLAERNRDLPLSFQIENHLERLRDLAGAKGHVMAIFMTADRERYDAIELAGQTHEHDGDGIASKMLFHPRWFLMVDHFADPNAMPGG